MGITIDKAKEIIKKYNLKSCKVNERNYRIEVVYNKKIIAFIDLMCPEDHI